MKIKSFISKVLIIVIILTSVTSCSTIERIINKKPFTVEFNKDNPLAKKYDSEVAKGLYISGEIRKLPDIQISKEMYTLHEAMKIDKTGKLKSLVEQFIKEEDIEKRNQIVEDIFLRWTGCDDVLIKGDDYEVDPKVIFSVRKYLGRDIDLNKHVYYKRDKLTEIYYFDFKVIKENLYALLLMDTHFKEFSTKCSEYIKRGYRDRYTRYKELKQIIDDELNAHPNKKGEVLSEILRIIRYSYLDSIDDEDKEFGFRYYPKYANYINKKEFLFRYYPEYANYIDKHLISSNDYTDGDDIKGFLYGVIKGGDGNDILKGDSTINTFYPGRGNDKLYGFGNTDIYVISRGDGVNTIYEDISKRENNILVFSGEINRDDISIESLDTDIEIKVKGTDDKVIIKNQIRKSVNHALIRSIYFSDGEVYNVILFNGKYRLGESGNILEKEKKVIDSLIIALKNDKENKLSIIWEMLLFNYSDTPGILNESDFYILKTEEQPNSKRYSDTTADGKINWQNGDFFTGLANATELLDKIRLDGKKITFPIKLSTLNPDYKNFELFDYSKVEETDRRFYVVDNDTKNKMCNTAGLDRYTLVDRENRPQIVFLYDKELNGIGLKTSTFTENQLSIDGIGIGNTFNEMYEKLGEPYSVDKYGRTIIITYEGELKQGDSKKRYKIVFASDTFYSLEIEDSYKKVPKKNVINAVEITIKDILEK